MSALIKGEQPAFDGPELTIITPVYVTNPDAAKRLVNRMDSYAQVKSSCFLFQDWNPVNQ